MTLQFARILSVGLCACVAIVVGSTSALAQKPLRPDLAFLLIGEVNMFGQGELDKAQGDLNPIPGVLLLNDKGEWEAAMHPLNRYSSIGQEDVRNQFGPGAAFAARLRRSYPDVTVGLIVNARMNSQIQAWGPQSPIYRKTILRAKAVPNIKLGGVLWHQGESDQFNEDYLELLIKLVEQIRTDLNEPELPFIAGEVHGYRSQVNGYLQRLPSHVKWTSIAPAKELKAENGTQFTRESQLVLGARFAESWLGVARPKFRPQTAESP